MKAKSILFQLLLAIAAASFASGAAATMYKWTDKDGTVHYTETPPEEGNATEIAPPPHVTPPPAAATNRAPNADSDNAADKNGEKKEAALSPQQQEIYNRNCEAAKANLELFKTGSKIEMPSGEVLNMDDATRAQKIQQTEEQIKKFCK